MTTIPTCDEIRNVSSLIPPEFRPTGAAFQFAWFIVFISLLFLSVFCFAYFKFGHPHRKQFYRIQDRQLTHIVLTHLGASFACTTGSYLESQPLDQAMPCFLQILLTYNVVPFLAFPLISRLYGFYRNDELTKMLVSWNAETTPAATTVSSQKALVVDSASRTSSIVDSQYSPSKFSSPTFCRNFCKWQKKENKEQKVVRLRNQKSKFALFVLFVFMVSPYFFTAFLFIGLHPNVTCYGCTPAEEATFVLLAESVLGLLLVVGIFYINRNKSDRFGNLREIKYILLYGGFPAVVFYALSIFIPNVDEFKFSILTEVFLLVFCVLQTGYQCALSLKELHVATRLGNQFTFSFQEFTSQVISPGGLYYDAFSKHLEYEHAFESMLFLNAVAGFEKQFFDLTAKTNMVRMKKIIAMFVGDNAVLPCNFSAQVIEQLLTSSLEVDMFAKAKEEIGLLLYRDSFVRFRATEAFQKLYGSNNNTGGSRMSSLSQRHLFPHNPKTAVRNNGVVEMTI